MSIEDGWYKRYTQPAPVHLRAETGEAACADVERKLGNPVWSQTERKVRSARKVTCDKCLRIVASRAP